MWLGLVMWLGLGVRLEVGLDKVPKNLAGAPENLALQTWLSPLDKLAETSNILAETSRTGLRP